MGTITNLVKNSASKSFSQLKSYDVKGKVNSALDMSGINFSIPDSVKVPDEIKNFKPNFDTKSLKLPAGIDSYISPVASQFLSGVKLPAEIGGVKLPELPDLSSVTSQVDGYLSGFGFDTKALGIRSVEDILKEPDLSSLKNVTFESIPEVKMPDLTSSFNDINLGEMQEGSIPGMESFDISQYF